MALAWLDLSLRLHLRPWLRLCRVLVLDAGFGFVFAAGFDLALPWPWPWPGLGLLFGYGVCSGLVWFGLWLGHSLRL